MTNTKTSTKLYYLYFEYFSLYILLQIKGFCYLKDFSYKCIFFPLKIAFYVVLIKNMSINRANKNT